MLSSSEKFSENVLSHFLCDSMEKGGGGHEEFTFSEQDLLLCCSKEIDMNDQPAQVMLSHPKIPGLAWIIFFYRNSANQYQPKIAYDLPPYLRADCDITIQFAGIIWQVKQKFEGSSWIIDNLSPKTINDRWCTVGLLKRVDVRINVLKIWFKFPLFSCCCHPTQTKKWTQQVDFTSPDAFSDIQLLSNEQQQKRLFAHSGILAAASATLYDRLKNVKSLNQGDQAMILTMPFQYCKVLAFLKAIYPNSYRPVDRETVEGLMEMAKEYHVQNLLRKCECFLFKELEFGSMALVYYLARKFELKSLQKSALLHLNSLDACQLQARINFDMKQHSPEAQENLLKDLTERLAENTV